MTLHTIVSDNENPDRLWLAISAAGVFASEDGGVGWESRNRLANAEACTHHDHPAAPRDGMTGLCVHNMVCAPGGDILYQQNHHGVFRSPDGGLSWQDATEGLPSTFGFPIAVHPRDPAGVYFGANSGSAFASFDEGESWSEIARHLPTVLSIETLERG